MAEERLQKILAAAGYGSRRACETLILEGAVTVNGSVVTQLGSKADADKDDIRVGRQRIRAEAKVHLLLNKPAGYTTTRRDPHATRTVIELIANVAERVNPVGRLDADTEGVLLFTNDGELANRLTHPRYGVKKTYRARVRGLVTPNVIEKLKVGVRINGERTGPADVKLVSSHPETDNSVVELTLREGKKRQVKEMMRAVGHPVRSLRRLSFAGLTTSGVPAGCYRYLKPGEVARLRKLCELA